MRRDCNLLVIGSGAAGLCAAVTAAHHGLGVILAEKAPVPGGTTAWSGGWIWAPGNPVCARSSTSDTKAAAETYLRAVLGNHYDPARVDAFDPRAAHGRLSGTPPTPRSPLTPVARSPTPMVTCPEP